jgi:hypothetical protein
LVEISTSSALERRAEEARRQGSALAWHPNLKSEEDATGLRYSIAIAAESTLEVTAIEFVVRDRAGKVSCSAPSDCSGRPCR